MRLSRLLAAASALAGAAAMTLAAASPASADVYDLACNYDYVSFNACLHFDEPERDVMTAQVGLDAHMPERYAQEIVSYGAGFQAQLYWENGSQSRYVTDLTIMAGSPSAWSGGLSGDLQITGLARAALNMNSREGQQERFYAVVSYFDFHGQGQWKSYRTGTVSGDFAPYVPSGGGGGCLVACQ